MRWWTGNGTDRPLYGREIDRCHPLAQGLVAAWLFNECGGSLVTDYVNMRQSNPLPAGLSLNGQGLNGNGQANAQIVLPYSLNLIDGGGPYSVMAVASWTSTTKQLIYTEDKPGVIGNALQIVCNNSIVGDVNIYCAPTGTYTGGVVTSPGPWNDNKLHLIICTSNGTNGIFSLYIDGILQGTSVQPIGSYLTSRETLCGFAGNTIWGFDGNMQLLMMWNREISQSEVVELFSKLYEFTSQYNVLNYPVISAIGQSAYHQNMLSLSYIGLTC